MLIDNPLNKRYDIDEIEKLMFDDFNSKSEELYRMSCEEIVIDSNASEKEIEDLKNINHKLRKCEILVKDNEKNSIEKVKKIVDILVDNNQYVILKIFKEKDFPFSEFKNTKYINKVKIGDFQYGVEISQAIRTDELLNIFVKDIKESNLSPFEKYISVYNIVKKYKQYNETPGEVTDEKMKSRNIYNILFNDYMVCVGYSEMLKALCNKIDIPCTSIDCYMNESVLEGKEFDDKAYVGHERNMVYLKDPKYNLDGYYYADACWDNFLDKDSYTYLALTPREITNISVKPLKMQTEDLLDVDNIDEFLRKLNYLPSYSFNDLIELIKNIDSEYYEEIREKYDLSGLFIKKDPKLIADLYTHIQSKTKNKEIDGKTIERAVRTVHKRIYPDLSQEKRIDDLVDMLVYNDIRAEQEKIEKTNDEGTEVIGIGDKFKF